jgi:hypothetical protein
MAYKDADKQGTISTRDRYRKNERIKKKEINLMFAIGKRLIAAKMFNYKLEIGKCYSCNVIRPSILFRTFIILGKMKNKIRFVISWWGL